MKYVKVNDISYYDQFYRKLWWSLSNEVHQSFNTINPKEKIINERNTDSFIDKFICKLKSFPEDISQRENWKESVYALIDETVNSCKYFKLGVTDTAMRDGFIDSTKKFIKEAWKFDRTLSYADIGQALRNVWIVNILQKIFSKDIGFTDAIFGYSMLYPYTDNYLDDGNVTPEEKKEFNGRFHDRLTGTNLNPLNDMESKVFQMISCIENVFDRIEFQEVYSSLMLIYEGQALSVLKQQQNSIPYEEEILDISILKGGASVLADAVLIEGRITEEESRFSFGYGFFLQLSDDLQDVLKDKKGKHMTVYSQLAGKYKLDGIVNKTINLLKIILDMDNCFQCENVDEIKQLIYDNCMNMIFTAVIMNKRFFSRDYVKNIKKYLPYRERYIKNIKGKIDKKISRLQKEIGKESFETAINFIIE